MAAAYLIPILILAFTQDLDTAFGEPAKAPTFKVPHEAPAVALKLEGMVYCQNCSHMGTWSLTGAKPLPSAKVSITCKDSRKRVNFYETIFADEHAYFTAPLGKMGYFNLTKGCTVRLVSSPDAGCNLPTNVNYGISGAPLRDEKKAGDAMFYAAGPLAFRPAHCPPNRRY